MTMVGFDVAKNSLVAAVLSEQRTILEQNITILNTDEALSEWLGQGLERYPNLQVTCESTGYYHWALLRVTAALAVPCQVLNPIVSGTAIRTTIRGKKTDRSDAILIAELGINHKGHLAQPEPNTAKTLLRSSVQLRLTEVRLGLLQRSFGERLVTLPAKANTALKQAQAALNQAITVCRYEASSQLNAGLLKRLCTIPGIGIYTASVMVSEIRDVSRFSSVRKLIGFSGLDPRVRQSGSSLHRNTKLTKRGSAHLRRAIFIAANVARRYDPELKAYYERKRSEGRTYTEAMIPVCRKLLARVYAVWKREQDYVTKDPESS